MEGEDLTALFDRVDEDDLPDRPMSVTAIGSSIIVPDSRWLMVADREQLVHRLYDDDEKAGDDTTTSATTTSPTTRPARSRG